MPDPRAPSKKIMSRKGIAANTRSKPPVFSSNSVNSNIQVDKQDICEITSTDNDDHSDIHHRLYRFVSIIVIKLAVYKTIDRFRHR